MEIMVHSKRQRGYEVLEHSLIQQPSVRVLMITNTPSKVSSHCSGDHHVPKPRIDPNTSNGGATYLSMVGWHYFKGHLHRRIP